jgi:hypothetical protein
VAIPPDGPSGGGNGDGASGGSAEVISGTALSIGARRSERDGRVQAQGIDAATVAAFTKLGFGTFTVPGLVIGVPGLLVVLAVLFQLAGAGAWVPIARRWLSGVGVDSRRSSRIVRGG